MSCEDEILWSHRFTSEDVLGEVWEGWEERRGTSYRRDRPSRTEAIQAPRLTGTGSHATVEIGHERRLL